MDVLAAGIIIVLGSAFTAYYAFRSKFGGGYWRKIKPLFNLRLEKPIQNVFLAGLAGIALELALLKAFGLPGVSNAGAATAFSLFLTGFLAPVWEESVYRGWFFEFPRLINWGVNNYALLLASSAAFVLAHDYGLVFALDLLNARVIGHFAWGLLLGALYLRERNLLPAMVAHGTGNALIALLALA